MGVRIPQVVRLWGLGSVLTPLVVLALLLTPFFHRGRSPLPLAAAWEPPADSDAPDTEQALAIRPPEVPALSPVVLKPDVQIYHGKEFRFVKTLTLRITAYAPDPRCTYPYDGKTTASGLPVTTNGGHLVAADTDVIPMHSLVIVPGYAQGRAVPVLDRGGAIKGHRLDVLLPTFERAKAWGVRTLQVKIYEPVE
jgi:3D (Asp-Asp-Asp) domain-containing protein